MGNTVRFHLIDSLGGHVLFKTPDQLSVFN